LKDNFQNEASLQSVIAKLENLFDKFNEKFFKSKLQKVVISVSPDNGNNAHGWFTLGKMWKGENEYHEINIVAESLNRPFLEVCATLLHEMVHLNNNQKDLKDTSRGLTYHNKVFKTEAEKAGLIIEHSKRYGWSITSLHPTTEEFILKNFGEENQFKIYRKKFEKEKKAKSKQSSRKYVCLKCKTTIRATKKVNVTCTDCDEIFEEVI